MDMDTTLITAVGALASAVVYLFGKVWVMHNDSQVFKDKTIKALSEKVSELNYKVLKLEKEKAAIHAEFIAYASSHDSAPFPMWMKDVSGRIMICNKSYEREFLAPMGIKSTEFVGNKEDYAWPDNKMRQSDDNDQLVLSDGATLDTYEIFPTETDPGREIRVIKWPRYFMGVEQPFGVAAIAVMAKKKEQ